MDSPKVTLTRNGITVVLKKKVVTPGSETQEPRKTLVIRRKPTTQKSNTARKKAKAKRTSLIFSMAD